jgi:hypothetical protein
MLVNKKAVSTIILVILILCSAVFGALLSYLWVMGNFYLEPENTVDLVITQVDFPVDHADYFYVTVMNPSHSPSGTNITEIYFTVEGDNKLYNVTSTYPEALPITIERGTSKTIRCDKNWGQFAGKTIMVHVASTDASGAAASIETQYVKLEVSTRFNATVSCKQFNVTINNDPQSAINLTLTKIYINMMPVENISQLPNDQNVTFPINASTGNPISLRCWYNWETFKNPTIRVETSEGYYAETSASATASILLLITDVKFNETKPDEISIEVSNSQISSTPVDISDIVLTYRNGTQDQQYHINGTLTTPKFAPYYRLGIGNTTTFNHCIWNWRNYRDQNVTITVYTKQGYTPASKIVPHTPGEIIFHISSSFNLTDTAHFSVNVTNMQCSLQNITVTQIKLNTNLTSFTSGNVSIGEWRQFNCDFDWATFRGSTVTITVNASNTIVFQNVTLPHMLLKIVNANFTTTGNGKEFNVTIENIGNSSRNATIARIVVRFGNDTVFQSEGIGYVVEVGKNATLTFSWDWSEYETEEVTISVYTTEELEFFNTFIV